ncbi:MAG: YihY family inner membrane protein [Legionellales bacterium]|nr:YihY family inner membrane protein [Legionellales bacterium]
MINLSYSQNDPKMKETLLNRCQAKLEEIQRFLYFVVRHFIDDDCTYRASALAFSTLLAIVPLIIVGFAVLSTFPAFQNLADPLQHFIFENFVPTTGKIIQEYLQSLSSQVSKLSIMGVVFLLSITLLVMYTIESTMNKIWKISSSRQGISAFLLYWAIVSLAPVLLGISIALSSTLLSIPLIARHDAANLLNYLPFLFSLIAFTFFYIAVPNCPVKFLHGLYGGVFAAFFFESAKLAFTYVLTHYNGYQLMYGAFAAIPVFFVWIYWAWFITLIGAEISYAFSVHHLRRLGRPLDGFSHALLCLHQLWLAQLEGKDLNLEQLINASQQAYAVDVGVILKLLTELRFIQITRNGHYLLSRNLDHLTLFELTQSLPYPLPSLSELKLHEDLITHGWQVHLQKADHMLKNILDVHLNELFQQP